MTREQLSLLSLDPAGAATYALAEGAVLLRGFAKSKEARLFADVERVAAHCPFRHLVTPGGFRMSVAMTNCGELGWVSDERGYRYSPVDPQTGFAWPAMPQSFFDLATTAARSAGYPSFVPDACLVNRYAPGARLTLHQDKNERDARAPIVSVSLGLSAVFLFGGAARSDRTARVPLVHGDVVVWGGPSRFFYHGVLALEGGVHPLTGGYRINLTFRKAV
ncbi:MAG: DNA oxidative demethylase AlkB [Polyangiaceae bacterium]|nr:DNA oxidative demethylase AlkB [Polyangiaceae bacterium]